MDPVSLVRLCPLSVDPPRPRETLWVSWGPSLLCPQRQPPPRTAPTPSCPLPYLTTWRYLSLCQEGPDFCLNLATAARTRLCKQQIFRICYIKSKNLNFNNRVDKALTELPSYLVLAQKTQPSLYLKIPTSLYLTLPLAVKDHKSFPKSIQTLPSPQKDQMEGG